MLRISIKKQRNLAMSKITPLGKNVLANNNPEVYFESSLEADFMYLLEFNPDVKFYYERPLIIRYKEGRSTKEYLPNFLVDYHNGNKELVELKFSSDLALNQRKYQNRFESAQNFCKENNLCFKILSETNIHTARLFNAKFLSYYQKSTIHINDVDVDYLILLVKRYKKIAVKELLPIASKDEYRQAELLYVLWYAIAHYLIHYDEDQRLSMETTLSLW